MDPLTRALIERRRAQGLTQIEVARAMETSRHQILRFEAGDDRTWEFINRYAAAVNASIDVAIQYLYD